MNSNVNVESILEIKFLFLMDESPSLNYVCVEEMEKPFVELASLILPLPIILCAIPYCGWVCVEVNVGFE